MSEYEELVNERKRMLEDAMHRAEMGIATAQDWDILRFECGLPRREVIYFERTINDHQCE